jgi:hypothetical protein
MLRTWNYYAKCEIPIDSVLSIEVVETDCKELPSEGVEVFEIQCTVRFTYSESSSVTRITHVNRKSLRGWPTVSFGSFQNEVAPQTLFDTVIGNVLNKLRGRNSQEQIFHDRHF